MKIRSLIISCLFVDTLDAETLEFLRCSLLSLPRFSRFKRKYRMEWFPEGTRVSKPEIASKPEEACDSGTDAFDHFLFRGLRNNPPFALNDKTPRSE